jgi:hypothetical protein
MSTTTQHTSDRSLRLLTTLCGLLGVAALVVSFAINPGPPPGATAAEVIAFANQHRPTILVGAWLQGIGSLLNVLFVLALVHLAGARHRFAGWLTLLAGATVLMVSLVEVTGYLVYAQASAHGDLTGAMIGTDFTEAIQHVFLIAPALLLPLGAVLLGSRLLPRVFGYLALMLGSLLQILGLVGLFTALQPVIDNLLTAELVWMAAAAIALALGRGEPATIGSTITQPIMDGGSTL